MKMITYQIPKKKYEYLMENLGSQKAIVDYVSLKLDDKVRSEAFKMKHRDNDERKTLLIPVEESLFPLLLEYCLHRGLSKTELINKLLYTI